MDKWGQMGTNGGQMGTNVDKWGQINAKLKTE